MSHHAKGRQVVIVGPGAIGCLFAGFFGEDCWLLDNDPERAKAIADNGISIDDENGSRNIVVNATANPSEAPVADVLLLCVKSYDTDAAIEHAKSLINSDTMIVSLQNGYGNAEEIAKHARPEQIICGVTVHGSTNLGSGHVYHAGNGPTVIAPFLPGNELGVNLIIDLFSANNIDVKAVKDAESLLWSKLIVNSAINPLTVISNIRNGQLLQNKDLRQVMVNAVSEAAQVAQAKGIKLLYEDPVKEVEAVCQVTENNISSMLQDVRHHQQTEIDFITKVIVTEAHDLGIDVPVNEMLLEEVERIEKDKL